MIHSLALLVALASSADEPTFETGNVTSLGCRVVDARPCGETFTLLSVEIVNSGRAAAEPLDFTIELPTKSTGKKAESSRVEVFHRATLPRFHRYGRPTPPGGKQKYFLATALNGKKAEYRVAVASASFVNRGDVSKPELFVGGPKQVERTSVVGTFPVTAFELKNPFDRALDALFLVTLTQPLDSTELVGVRIPAGASRNVEIATRPGKNVYLEGDSLPTCAIKATKVELVDWSLVAPPDEQNARALLQPAYEPWLRWPEDLRFTAEFEFHGRIQRTDGGNGYDVGFATGRVDIPASGKIELVLTSDEAKLNKSGNVKNAILHAFADLRRADFQTVCKRNELRLLEDDRVECRGPGFASDADDKRTLSTDSADSTGGFHEDVEVKGGRIASDGLGETSRTMWECQDLLGGYVVTHRRSDSTEDVLNYGEYGGLPVVLRASQTVSYNDKLFSAYDISFSNYEIAAKATLVREAPKGGGAAALRAIWDASYRYPRDPRTMTASFVVTNPGTDWMWHGMKKVSGKLRMVGIGRDLRSLHVDFDGKLSPEVEMSLVGALSDRLLMWYGSDLCDRSDFDVMFAGATIESIRAEGSAEGSSEGAFAIDGVPWLAKVTTANGLVTSFVYRAGGKRSFTHAKVDGRFVVSKVEEPPSGTGAEKWNETVTITHARVGEILLPATLKFERVFGKDWGPETIAFDGWKIE